MRQRLGQQEAWDTHTETRHCLTLWRCLGGHTHSQHVHTPPPPPPPPPPAMTKRSSHHLLEAETCVWQCPVSGCLHRNREAVPAVKDGPLPGFHQQCGGHIASARLICCAATWGLQLTADGWSSSSINKRGEVKRTSSWLKHKASPRVNINSYL